MDFDEVENTCRLAHRSLFLQFNHQCFRIGILGHAGLDNDSVFYRVGGIDRMQDLSCQFGTTVHAAEGLFRCIPRLDFGISLAAAYSVSSWISLPFGQLLLAYAPGGLEAMIMMAFILDLDPAFVAAHQLVRYIGMILILPFLTQRLLGSPGN